MELVIIIISIISIIAVNLLMKPKIKEMEEIALNEELNKIAKRYPQNMEICRSILSKLDNKTTKIEENTNSEATLYIAVSDKILLGNTHKSFTRIQTIAHECLHSIQDKKMLIFNFVFSNIYIIYFIIICGLLVFNKLPNNNNIFSSILIILGLVYYTIRTYLENDAMIKAEYLAKEYINEQNISTDEEKIKIFEGFNKLNKSCIKGTNCELFTKVIIKVIIFNALALIF